MYKNLGELMKMTPQEVGEYIAHLEATDEVARNNGVEYVE